MKTISFKFKYVLAVVFAVILCVCLSIITAKETKAAEVIDSGICGENLTWTLDDEGTLTISGSGEMTNYKSKSPWSNYWPNILTAQVEDGVTSIGDYAFEVCMNLNSITLPNSVTRIGNAAFSNCHGLTQIAIPTSVTSIGNNAFLACSITELVIPDSVIYIGEYAFSACHNLTTFVIGNSVTSIGESSFSNCENLSSVIIGKSVESIGENAFQYCNSLTEITIPTSVTSIGSGAFYGCRYFTELTIPASVTYIGENAFQKSASLRAIYGYADTEAERYARENDIPFVDLDNPYADYSAVEAAIARAAALDKSLYTNDSYALITQAIESVVYGKSVLEQEEVNNMAEAIEESIASLVVKYNYTLLEDETVMITGIKETENSITIPRVLDGHNVVCIGDKAFYYQDEISSVVIPDTVTTIGEGAFLKCSNLTSVTIGESVTVIGQSAFEECSSLTEVIIPDTVTTIGEDAFSKCSNLTSVTIGESVTVIGQSAFEECSSLTEVIIPDSVITIGEKAFGGCQSVLRITIGNSVTTIGDYAFRSCQGLVSLTIPESVTSIGNGTFYDCTHLADIIIPESVESIGGNTFYNCINLTSFVIPNTVKSIGSGAFYGCRGLSEIIIPNSVESIGKNAFTRCISLKNISISESVTAIEEGTFSECESLTEIEIPNSVTIIAKNAFSNCISLTSITMGDTVTKIGLGAFSGCSSLTHFAIPDSITIIENSSFYGCRSLSSVIIPESVTKIEGSAFCQCISLTEVVVPESVESIGTYAFYKCDNLKEITIPRNVTSIGLKAIGYSETGINAEFIIFGYSNTAAQSYAKKNGFPFYNYDNPFADYSAVDAAIERIPNDLTIYTEESVIALNAAQNAVVRDYWSYRQAEVDAMAQAIEDAIAALIEKPADYTLVEYALAKVNAINRDIYTINSIEVVDEAVAAVVEGKTITQQAEVDAMAQAIEDAISGLVEKPADYTRVDEALAEANVLNRALYSTESLNALDDAIEAVVEGKTTTQQAEVDAMAQAIEDAIAALELKIKNAIAWGSCGAKLVWFLDDEGTLTISGSGETGLYTNPEKVPWNEYRSNIKNVQVEEGAVNIGGYAFCECSNLVSVTLPESITWIGDWAFHNCSNLLQIDIPINVTGIGSYAFYGCISLKSVSIPENVVNIGRFAFSSCSGLTDVLLSEGLTSIGVYMFNECGNLKDITIANSVTSIGEGAFSYCDSLTGIALPDNLTEIGSYAFWKCSNLESIEIPDGVTSSLYYAFGNCSALKRVVLPSSMTSIGENAFVNCSSLRSVVIPDSVYYINSFAFSGCSSLTSIIIPDSVTTIGPYAFDNCMNLKDVVISDSVTLIGMSAFSGDVYTIFTVPGSYAASYYDPSRVCYLVEESGEEDTSYLGFTTDRIILTPNKTVSLTDYINTNLDISKCKVTVSDEDLFFYDNSTLFAFDEGRGELTITSGNLNASISLIATFDSVNTTGITLEKTMLSMGKEQSELLEFSLSPENATDNQVIWSSSDPSVVSVNNGLITAHNPGTATITVALSSNEEIKATCEVTVSIPLKAILTLEEVQSYSLKIGTSQEIIYYLYPSNAENVALSFTSSDPDIISIDENGRMTAHDGGTILITISSGEISKTVPVTVYVPLAGLSLEQTTVRAACGDSIQLTPIYEPRNTTERDISWSSNKEEVATVDEKGVVTVHGRGIATITATSGGYSAECTIVCNAHTWDEGQITTAPTCTEEGVKTFSCICGEKYTEAVPATGHTIVRHEPTEAACTTEGSSEYWSCNVCRHYFTDAEGNTEIEEGSWIIPALGHDMLLHEAVEATYEAEGNEGYWECRRCGHYFSDEDGNNEIAEGSWVTPKLIPDGWVTIAGETYYYKDRTAQKGWLSYEGSWYYLDPTTGAMRTGFVKVGSSTYYMAESGVMQTAWFKDNDIWYYANGSGVLQTGWLKSGATWYYLDPTTGAMQTGWVTIGGTKYYMAASGAMMTGWIKDNGTWYYANGSGAIQKGWVQSGPTWYYMDPTTGAMQTGWVTIGGTKYYMASSGAMVTGWVKVDDDWYFMNSSGAMQTGWVKSGNSWYYMKSNGVMAANEWVTGYYWINASGTWTYQPLGSWKKNSTGWWFGDTSGWYAKNETIKIDGVWYEFDAAGYWVQ